MRKWVYLGYCTYDSVSQQYTKTQDYLDKHKKQAV